jgi:hypothetical protein
MSLYRIVGQPSEYNYFSFSLPEATKADTDEFIGRIFMLLFEQALGPIPDGDILRLQQFNPNHVKEEDMWQSPHIH